MSRLRELYDAAHPYRADAPTLTEIMDWAATELDRVMADLVAEDMRFAHAQPGALDDCAEVEDRAPRPERIETRLKREGWR